VAFADKLTGRSPTEAWRAGDNEYVCPSEGAVYDRAAEGLDPEAAALVRQGRLLCGMVYARVAVSQVVLE
jgi:hypothetical protein